MNQKQKTMLKRIVAAAIVYIAAAAAKKMNVFAGMPQPWTELVVFLIPLVIVAFYPLIFAKFGDVYLLTSYGSLITFFIMGAALIAIGMFISVCFPENRSSCMIFPSGKFNRL